MKILDNDKAVTVVATLLKLLDGANPDVGMPPGWVSHVDHALELLDLTKADISKDVWKTR